MKRVMTLAVMLIAMTAQSQNKNVFWSLNVKPKIDHWLDYEKKVVPYVKTHFPNLKYRCWQVLTGENSGSFIFVIGPSTWKEMGTPMVSPKGEAAQKLEGQALDALSESSSSGYMTRQDDVSNVKADRKLKYLSASYYEIEIGSWDYFHDFFAKAKAARASMGSKMDIDYFRPVSSGPTNVIGIVRFMETLEEMDIDEKTSEAYDKIYGMNSYSRDIMLIRSKIKSTRSELRVLRTDLSQL